MRIDNKNYFKINLKSIRKIKLSENNLKINLKLI